MSETGEFDPRDQKKFITFTQLLCKELLSGCCGYYFPTVAASNPGETAISFTNRLMIALAFALPEDMRNVFSKVPGSYP